jgi:LPS sulfotransferase NodH
VTRVERSILICFVARSGSLFLSGLLASTGVLGRPEELFWVPEGTESRPSAASALRRGTSANGVFGCKLQLEQWRDVLERERRAAPELADRELVARAFPNPLYVWLQREDRLAQAVSWSRGVQTEQWRAVDSVRAEPVYHAEQIAGLLELIGEEHDDWERWFAEQGIEPHRVTYEQVLADRRAAVEGIARAAGVPLPDGIELAPYPGMERQADGINDEWIRRFRESEPSW